MTLLHEILDDARWAPSGDNTQVWRFEVIGDRDLVVHGFDTRAHCVYDLEGDASQISLGALLETMSIAAAARGLVMRAARAEGSPVERPRFRIRFNDGDVAEQTLAAQIRKRSVQRRALSTRPIGERRKTALHSCLSPGWELLWFEGLRARWQCATLMFHNAHLRLTIPEAYEVHRAVIEWGASESIDRVPDQALGADAMSLLVMRTAMQSWRRVHFANRFLAGTWLPRLQMDLWPAIACGAHWVLLAPQEPQGIDDFVAAGRQVQRLWLTATSESLWQQPEMTPLIFTRYHRRGVRFAKDPAALREAADLTDRFRALVGDPATRAVWMGRIGEGRAPLARSARYALDDLMIDHGDLSRLPAI
jgi:sulfur-carrier protein adenylyltransferase/sulfurtransferase